MIKSYLPAGGLADYLFSFSTANGKLDKNLPGELMWNVNGESSSELRILTAKRGDQTWKGCWIILGIFIRINKQWKSKLFVELHHTSIICLTSRSIKLMIEALFCSGNYMFSVLHNCYRYLYQYRRPCWADTTARSAAVCGCCCCLSSGHWADCLSPLPAADTAHTAAWPQLYTRSQSAPLAFLQGKKFWPPNGCLHDKNHFKIE